MASCAMEPDAEHIDPLDVSRSDLYRDDGWQEPFRRLRAEAPVHRVQRSGFGPYWSISTYRPIVEVESLPELFSSETNGFTIASVIDAEVRLPMFIGRDRPVHTAQRRTVAPAFTPSEMARLAADLRHRTAEVLDGLPWDGRFDWVERVSIELTTQMLAILFDFPWHDRAKLTHWSDWMGDIEIVKNPALRQQRLDKIYECGGYFARLWAGRAAAPPAPDLISMMAHSDAMRAMDANEFMGNLMLLIVGGNDTTRNTMSGLIHALHLHPGERARIEADAALIPNAASEIIRWQTPLAHMARTATQDVELAGQRIAAGDKVVLWYVSANRDESVFGADADAFRADRPNARRHLAFGHGIHRCVGARLAELQVTILLEEMRARRMRAHVTGAPERVAACFVHGYRKLPVELERY